MDGAQACHRYSTVEARTMSRRVGGRGLPVAKPLGVSLGGTETSADLGGSSKYSDEISED